ncbi:MAG: hypothetical protein MJ222_00195 [Bacilli bacterium]|nr:hypothetical protein [Bacilli bacterium]
MKKIKILSFASLPLAMALLAGCGHTHTFSEEWNHDANKHWHDATCEHKDQVSEEGEHLFGDDNICDVCGYDKGGEPGPGPGPTPHEHTFSEEWNHDDEKHWHAATCEHTDQKSGEAEHVYGDDNICDFCGYDKGEEPGPGPVADPHKVDAARWSAVFGAGEHIYMFADNYKATLTMSGAMSGEITFKVDGSKLENNMGGMIKYYSLEDGVGYEYLSFSNKWLKAPLATTGKLTEQVSVYFEPFGDFNAFTYDEESHTYKAASVLDGAAINLVVSFTDGKVMSAAYDSANPMDPSQVAHCEAAFVYGGQTVTLPEVEPAHEHVFDTQCSDQYNHWNECECGEVDQDSVEAHYDVEPEDGFCDVCGCEMEDSPIPELPMYSLLVGGEPLSMVYNSDLEQYEYCNLPVEADEEITVMNVTPGAEGVLTSLTIGDDAHGFTATEGVLKATVAGTYSFYLKPAWGSDVIYIAEETSPLPSEPVYGYKINDGEYITMDLDGKDKSAQWIAIGVDVEEGQTVTFANITPDTPETMPGLDIGGTTQGFTILNGVLTADHTGNYNFYLQPEFENDVVYIAENSVVDCRLMGMNDDWEGGILMSPVSEGSTEFVAQNLDIEPGDKIKVKFEDNWISDYKQNTGTANALDENLAVIDGEGNVQFNFAGVYTVYFESNTEGAYGVFVRRESVSCPYVGSADMTTPSGDIHQDATFFFHKVDLFNNFIEYYLANCPGYNGMSYTIKDGDTPVTDFDLEEGGEAANFAKVGSTITYHGTADALNFYLKEDLTEHTLKVYVEAYVDPAQYSTLYLEPGVWANDGATFYAFFFDSTKTNPDLWVALIQEDGLYKVEKVDGYDKVIFVRCDPTKDPLVDGWDAKWNQTQDLDVPTDSYVKCSITGWGEEKSPSTWQVK